jgi:hypothetical protein
MTSIQRWTSADLDAFPDDDGKRYEIIDGELVVSTQPHFYHQLVCGNIYGLLKNWNDQTQLGRPVIAPGLIFADDDDVVPDVAWLSKERLAIALADDGKLHSAPRPRNRASFHQAQHTHDAIARSNLNCILDEVCLSIGLSIGWLTPLRSIAARTSN